MASWSTRRRFMYSTFVIFVLVVLVIVPLYYFFYKPPTCLDGIKNGDEEGIDCGGSCVMLCQDIFLPPKIVWGGAKFEKISNGVYNFASLIENQNVDAGAKDVPYKITIYDESGLMIKEQFGKITLYPHRNSLAFNPLVNLDKSIPFKATFEFTSAPVWYRSNDELDKIVIVDKKYIEDDKSSSLEVVLENRGLFPYRNIDVYVVLSDINGNNIGFSRTHIDNIDSKNDRQIASYTWPTNRNNRVTTIDVFPIIEPVFLNR
jgi:hypothetical protein